MGVGPEICGAGGEMGAGWMMVWSLVGLVFVVAVLYVVVEVVLKKGLGEGGKGARVGDGGAGEAMPYRASAGLLTKGEAAFYHVLCEAVRGEGVVVMAKVRLLDLVWVPRGTERERAWKSRVQSKHVDFVVCEAGGVLRPRVVVELDDRSHEREDRRERDEWVDRVLEGVGVRVVRVRARGSYEPSQLRQTLFRAEFTKSLLANAVTNCGTMEPNT